ncbi:MAG: HAD-IC family P-type ATPase, partial [Candidatus Hermodarchaeota archaeon]
MMKQKQINAHSISVEEVAKLLETDITTGISEIETKHRLDIYGKNELVKEKGKTAWQIFSGQFKDFLVYLLLFAIGVSIVIGIWESTQNPGEPWSSEYTDAIVIASILVVNAILGFYQEYQAEKSMESLKKLAPHFARVRRNGRVLQIDNEDVVPGDIVLFEEGDKFPADVRIFKKFSLYADEAILTGESKPVEKESGKEVIGGSINGEGSLTVEVSKTGDESFLSQVINLVKQAQESKSRTQDIVNRAAMWLTVIALTSGAVTLIVWFLIMEKS